MGIDKANSHAKKRVTLDELKYFRICGERCLWQGMQSVKHVTSVAQTSESYFTRDKTKPKYLIALE